MRQSRKSYALLVLAIAVTALLYYIDSDPPTDSFGVMVFNTSIVFGIIMSIYIPISLDKKRRNKR